MVWASGGVIISLRSVSTNEMQSGSTQQRNMEEPLLLQAFRSCLRTRLMSVVAR